jgi:hypothetical protein
VRRETRINLVFLTAFLILALPGAVILFVKKLDPTAHRLDQPDPILHHLPYMSPLPAPPDIKWVAPDRTQAWVRSLTAPVPTASAVPPGPQWEPVISPDHLLQLLAIVPRPADTFQLTLLLWSDLPANAQSFTLAADDGTPRSTVDSVQPRDLPPEVRRELVVAGFVRPPKTVLLLVVEVHNLHPAPSHHLDLSNSTVQPPLHTGLDFKLPNPLSP